MLTGYPALKYKRKVHDVRAALESRCPNLIRTQLTKRTRETCMTCRGMEEVGEDSERRICLRLQFATSNCPSQQIIIVDTFNSLVATSELDLGISFV